MPTSTPPVEDQGVDIGNATSVEGECIKVPASKMSWEVSKRRQLRKQGKETVFRYKGVQIPDVTITAFEVQSVHHG
jgi:hypothetical protein